MNELFVFTKKTIDFFIKFIAFFHSYYYISLVKLRIPYRNVALTISDYNGRYGLFIRRFFYKKTLSSCGDNLVIGKNSYIGYRDTVIGNCVSIEEDCVISLCEIGDFSIIAHRVSIMSGGNHHDIDDLTRNFIDSNLPLKKVKIGSNVWIGVHSVVLNDISHGTVVGANSVITKCFEPNVVIAGVPAKLIRKRGL